MYHTKQINQVKQKEKSFLTTSFSSKNLQIVFTPFQLDIYNLLLKHPGYMTNEQISLEIGCTVRTVIRATNKFHEYGLITKQQKDEYSPNYYTIKKNTYTFSQWTNRLSPTNQHLYITHGIRIDHKNKIIYSLGNVTPKSSSLILANLFINLSPSSREARVLKKIKDTPRSRWSPQKGMKMYNYQNEPTITAKPKEKTVSKPSVSIEQRWKELENMVERCKIHLAEPEKYFKFGLEESIKYTKTHLQRCLDDLKELENDYLGSSNEKQSVLYQYDTNGMAAYSS